MDLNIMIVSGLTIVIAALIQGLTGFGFALVAVPILSSFLLPKEVVPMMVVYSLVMNILMFLQQKRFVQLKELRVLIVFGLIGIPFGVYLLNALSAQTIKLVAALLIIGTSMMMMLGWQWKTKSDFLSSAIAGLLSGILNGSTSMSGPPIVLFLANKKVGKESFRASLPTYGIITNLITLGFFLLSGNFNRTILRNVIVFAPGLLIGLAIGMVLIKKVPEAVFRKMSLILILITGLYTFVSVVAAS